MSVEALKALEVAVAAGHDNSEKWRPAFGNSGYRAMRAFHGSLDEAKALHEAVLPMHDAYVKIAADNNPPFAEIRPLTPMSGNPPIVRVWGVTPARAWLLAIIRALIAKAEVAE